MFSLPNRQIIRNFTELDTESLPILAPVLWAALEACFRRGFALPKIARCRLPQGAQFTRLDRIMIVIITSGNISTIIIILEQNSAATAPAP